ncbi:unnamed protein product, partial [Adineta steineri]
MTLVNHFISLVGSSPYNFSIFIISPVLIFAVTNAIACATLQASVGDQLFAKTFEHILNQSNIINYPNGTVWNPLHSCQSWFQNYR